MLGAYELAGFLSVVGRPARVLDTRPVDLGMRDAHVIRVSGSPIDRISLRMQGVVGPRQLLGAGSFMASVGPVPLASRGVLPVQATLVRVSFFSRRKGPGLAAQSRIFSSLRTWMSQLLPSAY